MREGQPSVTAIAAAGYRALHQLIDTPRLFDDPFAVAIVGATPDQLTGHAMAERHAMRAHVVGRSLFAEETLARALDEGVRQYVVLGAGLDTFAYRNPHTGLGLRVFEVDQPDTQAMKRERLAKAGIVPPEPVIYAPINFERETLSEGLSRAGFDAGKPAVFAWLGVVPYLTREAIMATLGAVAAMAPGTQILFDYGEPRETLAPEYRAAFDARLEHMAALGEPFLSFFHPDALAADLRGLGFSELEDLGATETNARFYSRSAPNLRSAQRAHVMRARV